MRTGAWTACDVPLVAVAPESAVLTSIVVQEGRGLSLPTLYLDEVGFDAAGSAPATDGGPGPTGVAVSIIPSTASLPMGQTATFTATARTLV